MSKKFQIKYQDPDTGETKTVEKEFSDSTDPHFISAKDWADDYAYMLADKGFYTIKEIQK